MTSNAVFTKFPDQQFNEAAAAIIESLADAGVTPRSIGRPGWQDKEPNDGPVHALPDSEPWAVAFPEGSADPFIAKYLQQRIDAQRDLGLTGDELLDRVIHTLCYEQQEIKIETTPEVIDQIKQLIATYDKVEHTAIVEPATPTLPQVAAFEKEIIKEVHDSYLSEALDGAKIRSQAKSDAELVLGKPDHDFEIVPDPEERPTAERGETGFQTVPEEVLTAGLHAMAERQAGLNEAVDEDNTAEVLAGGIISTSIGTAEAIKVAIAGNEKTVKAFGKSLTKRSK